MKHKLYSPSTGLWVNFDICGLTGFGSSATKFGSYDDAHDASIVMEAYGFTDVRIMDASWRPQPRRETYAELQRALSDAVR